MDKRYFCIIFLRITAGVTMLSIPFVFCPFSIMQSIHSTIGLGQLEFTPLLGYLTHSLSAMYGILGILLMVMTFDLDRYLPLIRLFGYFSLIGGGLVLFYNIKIAMPLFWILTEGPFTIILGLIVLFLTADMRKKEEQSVED